MKIFISEAAQERLRRENGDAGMGIPDKVPQLRPRTGSFIVDHSLPEQSTITTLGTEDESAGYPWQHTSTAAQEETYESTP